MTSEAPSTRLPPRAIDFRVRYAETDQMGVVYHTNYLVWCEVGRTDFIRGLGMSYAEIERRGFGLAVADLRARFLAPAKYDELIRVTTTLTEVKSRTLTFDYLVTNATSGDRLVEAMTVLVCIDTNGRTRSLPAELKQLFVGGG